jgi:hypothetical protein
VYEYNNACREREPIPHGDWAKYVAEAEGRHFLGART